MNAYIIELKIKREEERPYNRGKDSSNRAGELYFSVWEIFRGFYPFYLSPYASPFHSLSIYLFHLSLSLSLSLISPSLSISLLSLPPSLYLSFYLTFLSISLLLSIFSLLFSLAYLMDVFVVV